MGASPTEHDTIRFEAGRRAGLFRAADIHVQPHAMSRMRREGVIERIIPGVYVGTLHAQHPLIEAAAWTLRHPNAVACLLTAAVYYDLVDAFTGGTWLYVEKGTSLPRSRVAPVHAIQTVARYIHRSCDDENDVRTIAVHGVNVRITGPDRTSLDLWRYPRRIAAEHAIEALRRRVRADDFDLPVFARLARRLGAWAKVEPVVQGLVLR